MSGHITEERLNDYADGSLAAAERPALEAHLAGCEACRSELEASRALLRRLHDLPRSIEPPAGVRRRTMEALGPRRTAVAPTATARTLWAVRYPLAAAAVLLVVATATLTRWALRQNPAPTPVASGPAARAPARPQRSGPEAAPAAPVIVPGAPGAEAAPSPVAQTRGAAEAPAARTPRALPAGFRRDEARYADEIRALQQQLAARHDRLSPATVAILERNLGVIDRAIAESRAALARDPHAPGLAPMILSAYEQKVELLRRATSFSS